MKSFYREDLECLTFIFYNVVSSILLFSQHLSDFYAFFVLFILFLIFFLYFWFSCPLIHSFGSHLLHPCHTMPCIQSPNVRGGKRTLCAHKRIWDWKEIENQKREEPTKQMIWRQWSYRISMSMSLCLTYNFGNDLKK